MCTNHFVLAFINLCLISITQSALLKHGELCRISEHLDNYFHPDYSDYEPDEEPDICNFVNGKCIDDKCQCSHPGLMVYNEKLGECGIPNGHYCNKTFVDCFTGNECVGNICTCQSPRESLPDGTCTSLRQEECQIDRECSSTEFLSCFEGYCDCKSPMRTLYEDVETNGSLSKGCKIRAGESCTPGTEVQGSASTTLHQHCVSNAICANNTGSTSSKRQSSFNWICTCSHGYTPTPDGFCKKDYSQSCYTSHQECHSYKGLTCKNATCVCVDDDTCYDKDQKMCVSYVDQPCGLFSLWYDEYDIGCVKNAECVLEHDVGQFRGSSSNSRKVCKCKAGFVEEMYGDGKQCVTQLVNVKPNPTTTTTIATNDFDYSVASE